MFLELVSIYLPLFQIMQMNMLWFKFVLGLMFFELVSVLFAIVPHYSNEYTTKENKNWTSFKNFAPKLNLNHNKYMTKENKTEPVLKILHQN